MHVKCMMCLHRGSPLFFHCHKLQLWKYSIDVRKVPFSITPCYAKKMAKHEWFYYRLNQNIWSSPFLFCPSFLIFILVIAFTTFYHFLSELMFDFSACRIGVCHVKRSVQDEAENQVQDNAAAPWREGMFINDILKNINKHLRFCIEEYYSIII